MELEEDEEFNNQVQHDVQAIPIEERPAEQAKSMTPTKAKGVQIWMLNLLFDKSNGFLFDCLNVHRG